MILVKLLFIFEFKLIKIVVLINSTDISINKNDLKFYSSSHPYYTILIIFIKPWEIDFITTPIFKTICWILFILIL